MNPLRKRPIAALIALGVAAFAANATAQTDSFTLNFAKIEVDYASASVSAFYDRSSCTLWVDGDETHDVIRLTVDSRGTILVNEGHVLVAGGRATTGNTCRVAVDGGAGNDVLIDTTGLHAELIGGPGHDVLLWDDFAELEVRHTFALSAAARDVDLLLVNAPVQVVEDDVVVDGKILTAENYDAASVAYFDGKFLTAADLGAEQHVARTGRVLAGGIYDDSGDDVYVDGKIITAESYDGHDDVWVDGKIITADSYDGHDDVWVDGKIITAERAPSPHGKVIAADELGVTLLTLETADAGRRVVRVTSL